MWTWTCSDHLDPVADCVWPAVALGATAPDGGVVVDTFHCNSIDVDPANGNLLVSARQMDSVFYIDKSTGTVLWKMGGAAYTKDGATYIPVADPFFEQHDARLQPGWKATCSGGSGQISVFDDETGLPGPARAVIYDVEVVYADGGTTGDCETAEDAGANRATVAWQRQGPISADALGSFRILADGSRVIGWGIGGTNHPIFTEVDVEGHDLLDFDLDYLGGNASYRAIKVPLTAFDLEALRSTAGLP